jgi:hypothetical protein
MIYLPSSKEFKDIRKCLPRKIGLKFSKHALIRAKELSILCLPPCVDLKRHLKCISITDNKLDYILVDPHRVKYVIGSITKESGIVLTISKKKHFIFNSKTYDTTAFLQEQA